MGSSGRMANPGGPCSDRVPTSQRRIWSAISVAVASGSFADCLPLVRIQKRWLNGLRTSSIRYVFPPRRFKLMRQSAGSRGTGHPPNDESSGCCSATIILSLEQQLEFPSFPSKNQRRAAPPFVKRSAAERNKRGGGTPHAADAPSRPLRRLGRLGPLGLLQPVTGDVQLQDHAVMHQAVDRRRRRHRVLENHFPLRER